MMTHTQLPIIQSIPHGGLAVPPEVASRLAIDATAIYNECDLWAEQLYDFSHADLAALTPDAPERGRGSLAVITAVVARALVDVNRLPDDLENPDGPVKSQTSYGQQIYEPPLNLAEKLMLRERYWQPYHTQLVDALRQHAGRARLLLDCHNMAQHGPATYAYAGAARPLICLANLGNERGEPVSGATRVTCPPWLLRRAGALAAELFADLPLLEANDSPAPPIAPPIVALNWPFAGGILIDRYAAGVGGAQQVAPSPQAPYAIMIEVNRGLYVGDQRADTPIAPPNLERIALIRQRLYQWIVRVTGLLIDQSSEPEGM